MTFGFISGDCSEGQNEDTCQSVTFKVGMKNLFKAAASCFHLLSRLVSIELSVSSLLLRRRWLTAAGLPAPCRRWLHWALIKGIDSPPPTPPAKKSENQSLLLPLVACEVFPGCNFREDCFSSLLCPEMQSSPVIAFCSCWGEKGDTRSGVRGQRHLPL